VTNERQFGDAGDALDYALGHIALRNEKLLFLDEWRLAGAGTDFEDDWPGYMKWLETQHRCAREAKASRTPIGSDLVERMRRRISLLGEPRTNWTAMELEYAEAVEQLERSRTPIGSDLVELLSALDAFETNHGERALSLRINNARKRLAAIEAVSGQ